jgi:valyl-tRNA synthetase
LNKAFEELRFDGMADIVYHFVWDNFCDWYLEWIKPAFVDGEKQDMDAESQLVAGWVLDQILVMLHPFMPFITEELWHAMGERKYDIIHAKWPEPKAEVDLEASREVSAVNDFVTAVRSTRTEFGIPWSAMPVMTTAGASSDFVSLIEKNEPIVYRLAKVSLNIEATRSAADDEDRAWVLAHAAQRGAVTVLIRDNAFMLHLDGVIDLDAERTRITKAIEAATKERDALAGRLGNASFVEKAKPEAVEKARADHAEKSAEAERLAAALARLG